MARSQDRDPRNQNTDPKSQQSEEAVYRKPGEDGPDDPTDQDMASSSTPFDGDVGNIHLGHQREVPPGSLDGTSDAPFDGPQGWGDEFATLSRQQSVIDGLTAPDSAGATDDPVLAQQGLQPGSGFQTSQSAQADVMSFQTNGPIDVSHIVPGSDPAQTHSGFVNAFAFGAAPSAATGPVPAPTSDEPASQSEEEPDAPELPPVSGDGSPQASGPEAAAPATEPVAAGPEAAAPEADEPESHAPSEPEVSAEPVIPDPATPEPAPSPEDAPAPDPSPEETVSLHSEPENQAPVAEPVAAQDATEDAAFTFDAATHFSDADTGDTLTYTLEGPSWLTVDEAGVLSGTPTNDNVGETSVTVTATDTSGASVDVSFTITVDDVNDAPDATTIDGQSAAEDASFSYDAASHFSDVDVGDTLTWAVSGPDWLSVDADGTLSGTPDNDDVGDTSVTVTATDASGASVSTTFTLTVDNVNDAPEVTDITDQGASEDAGFTYDASTHFSDVDVGDTLTWAVSGPDWLSIDADGTLSGTPADGDDGVSAVTVTATDASGASVSTTFDINVADTVVPDENDFDDALPDGEATGELTKNPDIYVATDADDVLNARGSDDLVYGQGGDDRIHGQGGDDTLYGQAGDDDLDGDTGDDILYGGSGSDDLNGNNGDDILYGGSGDDILTGGNGNDILIGGSGSDIAVGGGGHDIFILSEGDGSGNSFAGGAGGSWIDAIEVTGADASGSPDGPWTIVLEDGQTWEIDSDSGSLDLGDDVSGTITMGDGTTIDFTELERIEWGGGG